MDQTSSNKKHITKSALSFCIAFAGIALSITMLGPMVPVIQVTYGISLAQNGLLPFAQGIGAIIVLIISIVIADRFNKRTIMLIAYAVYNAALFMSSLMPPFWLLAGMFFFIGAGSRLTDALGNANMSELGAERKGFFLNLLHGCFGIGALLGPIIASRMVTEYGLSKSLLTIACLCSALFAGCLLLSGSWKNTFPPAKAVDNNGPDHSISVLLKSKNMWIMGFCSLLYVGFAIAMATWIPSYITGMGANSFFAATVVSWLWVGIIAGRFTYSILSLKYPMKKLIYVSNLIGGTVIILATLINTIELYIIGYIVSGFFAGAVVPLCIAIANKEFPYMAGRISSLIILFVSTGMMIVPGIIGVIAENVSFHFAILILNLCPMLIAALSIFIKINARESDSEQMCK